MGHEQQEPPPSSSLPFVLLTHIFSYLLNSPRDIEACSYVNKDWYHVATTLWKDVAIYHYQSKELVEETIPLYDHNYKELLYDDNRKGALRIFPINKPCYWKYNREGRFYCCIVVRMIWDRRPSHGGIYLYIDVRGEWDLRHPSDSNIKSSDRITCSAAIQFIPFVSTPVNHNNENGAIGGYDHLRHQNRDRAHLPHQIVRQVNAGNQTNTDISRLIGLEHMFQLRHFVTTLDHRFHPHYKGLLFYECQDEYNLIHSFDRDVFFCYANSNHRDGDYESIQIFDGFGGNYNSNNNNNNNIHPNIVTDNNHDNHTGNGNNHQMESDASTKKKSHIHYYECITYNQLLALGNNESNDVELERWNKVLPMNFLQRYPQWWVS